MISTQNFIQIVYDMVGFKSFKFSYLEFEKQVNIWQSCNLARGQIINDLDIDDDVLKCDIICTT